MDDEYAILVSNALIKTLHEFTPKPKNTEQSLAAMSASLNFAAVGYFQFFGVEDDLAIAECMIELTRVLKRHITKARRDKR